MRWLHVSTVPVDAPDWWVGWPLVLVADAVLVACVVWMWGLLRRLQAGPQAPAVAALTAQLEAQRDLLAQAKSALARSTESLRLATDLAEVGGWFWDIRRNAFEWTDRCKAHLGLPPGQEPSMDFFFSVVHPEDGERVRALIDRSLDERTDFHAVYRIIRKDGSHHWVAAMGRAQYAEDGTPDSMGGVTIDVTKLMRLQEELRASEALSREQAGELESSRRRFQLLAENATDVVMETDARGVIRWITPSVKTRIGREAADTVGTRFMSLVHPDDWNRVRALEDEAMRGTPTDAELRLRITDDGYQWFSVSMRPLFDAHQAVVGHVVGWRDIHREVLAREAAAHERHRLRKTLAGMLDPIVVFQPVRDVGGRIADLVYVDANPRACEWIALDRDHLLGSRLRELFPEAESSGLLRSLVAAADTGQPIVLDDFPFPHRGVGLRRLDIRGMRVDDLLSVVWRDVTDRHEVAERLAQSEQQFRLLAENALDVVVLIDPRDKVLWVSPSITPVLGWKAADCVGRDAVEFLATGESRARYLETKARVLAGQGSVARVQLLDAAGVVHWAEVHSSPFRTDESRIEGMVSLTRIVDAEVELQQALESRARTDDLTQLLNRNESLERLEALLARGPCTVAVMWCDIDQYKAINDVHGHAAGDTVLRMLADRIRGCLRTTADIAGRIGGDEFIVVLDQVQDLADAARIADGLRRRAAEPIAVDGGTIDATISIGVTLSRPEEGVDDILARADDAMYQAKGRGKNQVVAVPPPAAVLVGSP